jgi:hypothetical protein
VPLPARVRVRSNLPETHLEIVEASTGELAHAGVPDGEAIELAAGRYELRVEHAECSDIWSRDLVLDAGSDREIVAQTCRNTGWLIVRSNLSRDRLRIDGDEVGSTGPDVHSLAVGEHAIEVSKPGFQPWHGAIEVPAATTLTLRASLTQVPENAESKQDSGPKVRHYTPAREPDPAEAAADPGSIMTPFEIERTHEWHRGATRYLLTRYDSDVSGHLDTSEEVSEIPCDDWRSLEGSFDQGGLQLPLTRFYGFDGTKWVEDAFGITEEVRAIAYERMLECGLR